MTNRFARKRTLARYARRHRAIGALFASVVFHIESRKEHVMVATRDELRARKYRTNPPRPRRMVPHPRLRPEYVTTVHSYTIISSLTGETLATSDDGGELEFRGPTGLSAEQLHIFACRFLTRRGSSYTPARRRVITLDGRGRQRETVEV